MRRGYHITLSLLFLLLLMHVFVCTQYVCARVLMIVFDDDTFVGPLPHHTRRCCFVISFFSQNFFFGSRFVSVYVYWNRFNILSITSRCAQRNAQQAAAVRLKIRAVGLLRITTVQRAYRRIGLACK